MANKFGRGLALARKGDLWSAILWRLKVCVAMLQERKHRLKLGLERNLPTTLPAVMLSGATQGSGDANRLKRSFDAACRDESQLSPAIRAIEGMSGQRYRSFINNYVRDTPGARYLEIGSWAGSTATAAIFGNDVEALCIDNWSGFGGPRDLFFANIELARSKKTRFDFIESDFRAVDFKSLRPFNVYLFDGPHGETDQYDGVAIAQPALAQRYLLIVDDWNWRAVRNGTLRALVELGSKVEAAVEIRTTLNDDHPAVAREQSEWHNGYLLAVISKQG